MGYVQPGESPMHRFLRLINPPQPSLSFETPDVFRLVLDFSGTRSPDARALVAADIDEERFVSILRTARRGTVVEVCGLHLLPSSAESAARLVAKASRGSAAELHLSCDDAPQRWRRRFVGNLVRFGCIEPVGGISP